MKHIKQKVTILGILLCFATGAIAQENIDTVNLKTESDTLVNIAYRKVHKNDLMNAVSVVNVEDYIDVNYGSYALNGSNAYIGGANLWNIGGELLLVDGVPRSVFEVITDEIEQITYLKGANAVVLYGSRAANGVILITTKHGKAGERKSNVRFNTGINTPKSYPKYLGALEYMQYNNQARINEGSAPLFDSTKMNPYINNNNPYKNPDVDFYSSDYLRKMSNWYQATADFSGGNEKARFFALAGFERSNTLLNFGEGVNEGTNRLNLRGNIDLNINEYIKTYVNMSNVFYDMRSANGNYWGQSSSILPHRITPLIPLSLINNEEAQIIADGSRNIIDGKYLLGANTDYLTNPIADVYAAGYNSYSTRQFQYTSGLDFDLRNAIEGLSFHAQMGIDYLNSYKQSVNYSYATFKPDWVETEHGDSIVGLDNQDTKDSKDGRQNLSDNWNRQVIDFNLHFDYKNTFGKVHNVSAMLLAAGFRGRETGYFQYGTNANLGINFAYNFGRKYYADFSGAVVNSTKLPEDTRVAFSPTVSLGWLLSEESFLSGSGIVNRLKLLASAGIVNTDLEIANYYMYDGEFTSDAYFSWSDGTYTNRATVASRGANLAMEYVKRKELSFGLEGALLDNSILFKTNVFAIKKDGLLAMSNNSYPSFFRTYYPVTSFVPYANYEAKAYKGFDVQLDYVKQLGDIKITAGATATYIKTEVLVREEIEYEDDYRYRAGKPIDAIFGLESEGLFNSQEEIDNHAEQSFSEVKPGDIKYKDQNGDGFVNEKDEVMLGKWGSPFTGGLHITTEWNDFTLFVWGSYQLGGTSIKNNDYYWVYGSKKYSAIVRDTWTEENKESALYPRLTASNNANNYQNSSFWTYSTNSFNLGRVQLTYTLPKTILNISAIKNLKVYVSGANLLTISKNKDIMELNIGRTPQTRFYNLGIKAVF